MWAPAAGTIRSPPAGTRAINRADQQRGFLAPVLGGGRRSETGRASAHSSNSLTSQPTRRPESLRGAGRFCVRTSSCTVETDRDRISAVSSSVTKSRFRFVIWDSQRGGKDRLISYWGENRQVAVVAQTSVLYSKFWAILWQRCGVSSRAAPPSQPVPSLPTGGHRPAAPPFRWPTARSDPSYPQTAR